MQGYRAQDSSLPSDYTGVVGPISVFDANRSDRRKTWQEELRFASKQIGDFNFVAGAFYQHDITKFCVAQLLGIYDLFGVPTPRRLPSPGGYNNNPQVLCNEQTEKSEALYGETNYKFTEKTTLTIGARITKDSKDWIGRQQVFVQQLPSTTGAIVPGFTYQQLGSLMNADNFWRLSVRRGDRQPLPGRSRPIRATLSQQFTPDVFGYVELLARLQGRRLQRPGGHGRYAHHERSEKQPTNPEKADSFEVGMKSELFEHRIRLNEALFYVRYTDLIRQVVAPITNANGSPGEETLFKNAAKMTAYGLENEFTAQLADGAGAAGAVQRPALRIQQVHDALHAAVGQHRDRRLVEPPGAALPDGDRDGRHQLHPAVMPLERRAFRVVFDVNDNYVSKNLDTSSLAAPVFNQPWTQTFADARALVGASLTYNRANDRWFARFYGRNLTDKVYKESAQNVDPLWIWAFYGEPRFVGGEIGMKFGKE